MPRARRRRAKARLGHPPADRECDLWRSSADNLRRRLEAVGVGTSSRERIALRHFALEKGEEPTRLRRERTGR